MNLRHKAWTNEAISDLIKNMDLEEFQISNEMLNQSLEPDFEYSKDKSVRPPWIHTDPNHILFENFDKMENGD